MQFNIIKQTLNNETVNAVNARELHSRLNVGTKFSDWIKNRIEKYYFLEDVDFTSVSEKKENGQNSNLSTTIIEYYISLDMAKELCIVENNEQGKLARKYFIECEKKLKEQTKPMTITELIILQAQELDRQAKQLETLKDKQLQQQNELDMVKAKQKSQQEEYYSVAGYFSLKGISINAIQANKLGRQASKLSRESGLPVNKVYSEIFGQVNSYSYIILEEILEEYCHK